MDSTSSGGSINHPNWVVLVLVLGILSFHLSPPTEPSPVRWAYDWVSPGRAHVVPPHEGQMPSDWKKTHLGAGTGFQHREHTNFT